MKGLKLSQKYFMDLALPLIERDFGQCMDRIAAGLVGDGSECFGFDDFISRDHDWGPNFCIWLTHEDYTAVASKLQSLIDSLPETYEGFGPRRRSQWDEGRFGVFEIGNFYRRFIGLGRLPEALHEWLILPENNLAACTNGSVFLDSLGEFTRWRKRLLEFYPEDVRRKKIAARCMNAGQAGQYNFSRCVRRSETFSAQYAETKFCADAISMVFLLNRRYTPFYKWMHRAVIELPVLGKWLHGKISALVKSSDFKEKEIFIEEISIALIKELASESLTDSSGSFLPDHGTAIQRTIKDKTLRERNVWID